METSDCRLPTAAVSTLLALGFIFPPFAHAQTQGPPPVTILQDSGSLADGFIFIGPQAVSVSNPVQGPEIIDNQGRIVWFSPLPNDETAGDVRVQAYQGNPALTWSQASAYGAVNPVATVDYILDGTYTVVATVQAGNGFNADMHEFQLTPQNTALIAINDTVQGDLSPVGGPASGSVLEGSVQEIDIATGKVLFEWHSAANVALSESYYPYSSPASGPYDYFHINSVKLDADGNLLISSRHTWTVYKVNRTTGAIIWRLGGKKSDFTLGTGLPFAWQHDVEAVDAATIRIFDNESDGTPVLPYSRVIWVNHDDTAMTANIVQTLVHPEALSVYAEGSAQALANGDTFVEWGALGRITEFNSAGQLLFDASEAPGYASYRGFRFQWAGAPSTSPTAAALQNGDGTTAVHAIWNGATGVASWEVLGGDTPGALSPVGSAAWNGLDTVITVPGPVNDVQVVAMNSAGAAIGTSAPISGPFADVFPTQPASQTIESGSTVVFSVEATGSAPAYQWLFNGTPVSNGPAISGATGPRLMVSGATAANAGSYACVATNLGNSVTSNTATLAVSATTDVGRLINVSCRAGVEPGDGALITGFVVGGQGTSGSDPVLIRASGPALASLGVGGILPDPALLLYASSGILAMNNGWAGNSQIAATAALVGAFPWSSDSSQDSALDETLAGGPYTAVIPGANGNTGIALAEVYDAEPAGSRVPTTPRLINISGRSQIDSDDSPLIAGFVIGGTISETVLIRGSGPALASVGVSGTLPDPKLQLFQSNSDGTSTLLGANSSWGGDSQIAATSASVGAFSWGSSATADTALLVTLPPGTYTAVVSAASSDTGIALAEVYEVP